jgi:heat shock protein HslJ
MQPALVGRDVTLAFIDEQKLGGNASCNSYFGQYTSTLDGTLSVSGLGSTKMYCTEPGVMAQEQSFLNALAAAESYEVAEGKLHITGGGRLLVLTPD